MRLFYIENEKGERYDLNAKDGLFFDNPSGLGQTMSVVSADIHKGFFKDTTGDVEPQGSINGDIVFTQSAYSTYRTFINWLNKATALYFIYCPTGETEFRRRVMLDYIEKTQLEASRWLRCPVCFKCMTPFYRAAATTLSMEDVGSAMRYTYTYDDDLRYAASSIPGMSCEVQGQGHIPSAINFSVTGALANPQLTLTGEDSGTVYGKLKLSTSTTSGQTLNIISRYGETSVTIDGVNALQYVDLSFDPWIRIPTTEMCNLVLSSDDDMSVTVTLLMYDYYRSV